MSSSTAHPHLVGAYGPIPRGEKRRREIAIVAERVFFENGFSETTMQTIAASAGASKETLYRHFGSKEGLFAEIVETRAKGFLESLNEKFEQPGSVEHVLHNLGLKLLEAMVEPTAISLCRTVVSEASRSPELGHLFMASGPNRVQDRLTQFLAAARDRGELSCRDPILAARIFLGAIVSSYHLMHLVSQQRPVLSRQQMRMHVDEVVAMTLGHYAKPMP